jgi:hypothetical protein
MKNYFFLISLFLLISCGKNSENNKNNNTKTESPVISNLKDLAGKEYVQQTVNGESTLKFYETEGGSITVYLNYGSDFSPLKEYRSDSLKVGFSFDDYREVQEDVIELSKINLTSDVFIRNCSLCNRGEAYRWLINSLEKNYYDLLQGKETIRVKIIKGLNKNYFFLLSIGKHEV